MQIESYEKEDVRVVELTGNLDASCATEFRDEFLAEIANDNLIVVECQGLHYLDSSGLATLLSLHKNLAARDAKMVLCGLSDGILRVIKFTKLDKVLGVVDTIEDGIASIKSA